MECLERFKTKMSYSGNSLRSEHILNSRKLLEETFFDDASFQFGIYLWELGIKDYEEKNPINIRIFNRRFSAANGNTMEFQTLYDTPILVGDIVYDSNKNCYLICTESFDIDGIHWQGKFTLCNWILRWQNKYGDILEYPCYDMNTTQYNSGEQANRNFTIGSSQHMIILPCDENTVTLNTPQRFFLDKNIINPTSFIVTQNDTTSYNYGEKGLVRVTVMEYPNNHATDRIDLGICDYIDKHDIESDNSDSSNSNVSKSVISYNTLLIKSGGDFQVFTGKFYDNLGNEIIDVVPKWTIVSGFNNELDVKESDNQIIIGIDNDDYIDEEFKLILSDIDGNYSSSLIIKIDSLL